MEGLGTSFDAKTSINIKEKVRKAKKSGNTDTTELQKIIRKYKNKREFINLFGNGEKGKFDKFVVNTFLMGKVNKEWMVKLMKKKYTDTKENRRILVEEGEEGFDWGQLLSELKYWIYLISWMVKIGVYFLINKINSKQTITKGQMTFISLHRKIHFVLFNLVSIDVAFIGTRTLLHLSIQGRLGFQIFLTGVIYVLMMMDIIEVGYISAT